MSARRYVAGLATAAVAVATLATATSVHADPSFTPKADDIVGAGSDTSMFALTYLADGKDGVAGYNAGRASGRLVSFDAKTPTNSDQVTLVEGGTAITRPNGSGAGKGLLHGGGNNTALDYARSSSGLNAAEKEAGLRAFPFALDVLEMAIAKTSNAPASLTKAQIVKIYDGSVTNWSQVGGKPGAIVPMIPQSGSGTRSFFEAELKAANGSTTVVLAGSVREVQEHDDTEIKGNPNAIAPFSAGRAALEGTVDLVGGEFSAKRALYNVVRQSDVSNATILGVFGEDGFVCSDDARPLIEAAGFDQLAGTDAGGVCGEPTQDATSNFTINEAAETSTALTATSAAGGQVRLAATVSADGTTADGSVNFFEGETLVGSAPIAQGQAVLTLSNVAAGAHSYTAVFVPAAGAAFDGSTSTVVQVTVKAAAQISAAVVPTSTSYGKAAKVQVSVTGASGVAAGQVQVKVGGSTVSGSLSGGTATVTLPATVAVGTQTLTTTYAGNATYGAASTTGRLVVAKGATKLVAKFPKSVKKGKTGSGKVTVSIPGSSVKATGKVTVKKGKKVLGSGNLKNGTVKIKLAKLAKGKHKLVVTFTGNGSLKKSTAKVTVTQK